MDFSYTPAEQAFRAELRAWLAEHVPREAAPTTLDEEAASMMRFQRAYEANARFFTTVNETLDVLLNLGR